jgi:hypothetical protein
MTQRTFGQSSKSADSDFAPGDEWDELTTALNCWGVLHVAPGESSRTGVPRTAVELFARLALSSEPRLQQAAVVLLLTRPEFATDARSAIDQLAGSVQERAKRRYVAAAALQRMAQTRIALRLGRQPLIPPAYLGDLNLPPLDEEFGRVTLLMLAAQESESYGYDAWGTYWTLLDLFLGEIRREGWGVPCDSAPTANA